MQPLTIHRYGNPDASPVVLVHGLTEAGTAWPDLVHHWGDRWDVHAPDLRGHGLSPRFVQAWAACKPLVDRGYVHRGLSLGDAAWEELFESLAVPTLLLVPPGSEMAPDPQALRNPLVRHVLVPGSGHCVRRDQPGRYHQEVDAFLAGVGAV